MKCDAASVAHCDELESLRQVFNASPDGVFITRMADGRFVDLNAAALRMTGRDRLELNDTSTIATQMWCSSADREQFIGQLAQDGSCDDREYRFQRKDGGQFSGLVSARVVTIRNEPHVVSVIRDITARKEADEKLRDQEALYRSILDASPDDITITDLQGRLIIVSRAAHRIFGYPTDYDVTTLTIQAFIVPEDHIRAKENIERMYDGTYFGPNHYKGVRRDGSVFDIEVNSGFIHDISGKPNKIVFVVRDVTERIVAERKIQELIEQLEHEKASAQAIAMTDGLTGLANRRALDRALQMEFSRFKRFGSAFSLLLLDIDHFKRFNDHYGHLAGDDCLRKVAEKLTATVGRLPDLVARYGGEEFVVILPGTDASGAATVAWRIVDCVNSLAIPHATSETAACLTVSLGLATATSGLESHHDLMLLADRALYQAKAQGRNRVAAAPRVSATLV